MKRHVFNQSYPGINQEYTRDVDGGYRHRGYVFYNKGNYWEVHLPDKIRTTTDRYRAIHIINRYIKQERGKK